MLNKTKNINFLKARVLRQKGFGFSGISKTLKVPKSTIRLWCKDIVLSESKRKSLILSNTKVATERLEKIQSNRKIDISKNNAKLARLGIEDLKSQQRNPLFYLALGLYWGEGYKTGNKEIAITNSDPRIINIVIRLFKEFYEIDEKDLIARLSINAIYKGETSAILDYWSEKISLPLENFTKTSYIRTAFKRNYANKNHKGTLRVKILKPSRVRERLLSSIHSVEDFLI